MTLKKERIVLVRMTEQDWQALKAYAEIEDCSMAAVIRNLLKKLPKIEPAQNPEK